MKHNLLRLSAAFFLICVLLSSCLYSRASEPTEALSADSTQFDEAAVYFDAAAPQISFIPETQTADGIPEYYLFDDNPEHLNPDYLADGATPSVIAHFEDLSEGIYTVFSYHHRGNSCDLNADLYFDAAFSSENGGAVEILNLGLNNSWNWNQAWADYSNAPVIMPEYLRTSQCTCGADCKCGSENGVCINPDCPAIIRGESRAPKTAEYVLSKAKAALNGTPVFLTDLSEYIESSGLNHFRAGGNDEPMWLMMKFRVTGGSVTFDTLAYQNKNAAKENFSSLKKGSYAYEPQYKGKADNAPIVTAEFSYEITDLSPSGAIPVTVKNMRVPNGCTIKNGIFATNVNTWKEKYPIAAESDLMQLKYTDDEKLSLYGKDITEKSNIWSFDAFHTKTYSDNYKFSEKSILNRIGISLGDRFVPNGEISAANHPIGNEISDNDFYSYTACNLGNFGVTNRYVIHLKNTGGKDRTFSFDIKSTAGQVYGFCQTDQSGKIIKSDGGEYYMKKFDDDPAEDKNSFSKKRLPASEYSDTLSFDAAKNSECTVVIEVTTLTGCVTPTHNTMSLD